MQKEMFRIEYFDPETQAKVSVDQVFSSWEHGTAREVAEDWAYSAADKGRATITSLGNFTT
jgi:hypothetical protein